MHAINSSIRMKTKLTISNGTFFCEVMPTWIKVYEATRAEADEIVARYGAKHNIRYRVQEVTDDYILYLSN